MEEIRHRLETELHGIAQRIRRLGGGAAVQELSAAIGDTTELTDEGDVIRLNEDREMTFATRSLLVERANRLAGALERLEEGVYGTCEECGEAIAAARLRVMPEVTTCVGCQDRLERSSVRLLPVGTAFGGDDLSEDD